MWFPATLSAKCHIVFQGASQDVINVVCSYQHRYLCCMRHAGIYNSGMKRGSEFEIGIGIGIALQVMLKRYQNLNTSHRLLIKVLIDEKGVFLV